MKIKARWIIVLSSFVLLFTLGQAIAFDIPAQPGNYVNDYAHMLKPATVEQLNQALSDFEKKTSNQLVVVTIPSLDNQPIEDYSIHLAERWKIGTHEHNNGIILLLSQAEHKIRIEVGYGLEGVLPDATAEQIIQNEITPAFRQGDFDGGVERAVSAIMLATQNEYQASTHTGSKDILGTLIALFVLLVLFLRLIGGVRSAILFLFGMSSHIHTPFWDFISSGSGGGSSGGGFSGGGGGSFGGGGASGSW
jgi:uncharacterized protein